MQNLAVKVGLGWVAYEVITLILSALLSPSVGLVISFFIDRKATDPESMASTIELLNTSSTVLSYTISFVAFFCVCYFIASKLNRANQNT